MKTLRRCLTPLLLLVTLLLANPVLAKPLVGCDLTLDRTVLPAGQAQTFSPLTRHRASMVACGPPGVHRTQRPSIRTDSE